MKNNALACGLLFIFYGALIYVLLGMNIWMMGITYITVLFINAVCYLVLDSEISKRKYHRDDILLQLAFVQITLIVLFLMYVMAFEHLFNIAISPLTGHILFIGSFIVQALFLIGSYHYKWPKYALGAYAIVYLAFAFYYVVPYGLLGLLFGYVVVQNIVVITYGLLMYMNKKNQKIVKEG
jgi:hypothetical protein